MAVHGQNGLRWSLYPLLATMALSEFFLGIGHLLFCLPFYPFLIPITSAVFALITAVHALFLRFPNSFPISRSSVSNSVIKNIRSPLAPSVFELASDPSKLVDFVLQCCSTALGMLLLATSISEAFCGVGDSSRDDVDENNNDKETAGKRISMSQGLCYGLAYRTMGYQESCNDFLRPFHNSLATKLGLTSHTRSIRFVIAFSMSGLAFAHTATCTALAFYSASENGYLIRSYHGQLLVSIAILPAALLHRFYCCTYFYLWPALLVAFYAAFQGIVTWKHHYRGKFVRLANIFGSAAAMALVAVASFGIFCTSTRSAMDHFSFQRHCNWPSSEYHYCYRVIDFRKPYSEWQREYVMAEISAVQFIANLWLCLSAVALFFFSLKSAFTTEIVPSLLSAQ